MHLFFELNKRTTGFCENKKRGTLSQNEMDSPLVDPNCPYFELFYLVFINPMIEIM